jgi:hypothetical protein
MDQKDNSGALFSNKKKQLETHPDYSGKCENIEGWREILVSRF